MYIWGEKFKSLWEWNISTVSTRKINYFIILYF
jgi:hypothetical protein